MLANTSKMKPPVYGPVVRLRVYCGECEYRHITTYVAMGEKYSSDTCTNTERTGRDRELYFAEAPGWCPLREAAVRSFVEELK